MKKNSSKLRRALLCSLLSSIVAFDDAPKYMDAPSTESSEIGTSSLMARRRRATTTELHISENEAVNDVFSSLIDQASKPDNENAQSEMHQITVADLRIEDEEFYERTLMSGSGQPTTRNPTRKPTQSPTKAGVCNRNLFLTEYCYSVSSVALCNDPSTPQGKALNALLASVNSLPDPCTAPNLDQRYGMSVMYYAFNGANWISNTNWVTDTPECDWFGATCTTQGFVTGLDLENNRMVGQFPDEIELIVSLISMEFFNNTISGTIPGPEFGKLTNLELIDIEENSLSGNLFPPELFNLKKLQRLRASFNDFVGTIPNGISAWTSLSQFWFAVNKLTGTLPTALGTMTSLQSIFAYNNTFTGKIPNEFGNGFDQLRVVDFSHNALDGSLNNNLYQATNLESLFLVGNNFAGTINSNIADLTKLTRLQLNANEFVGSFPDISASTNLEVLFLHENEFTGTFPDIFGDYENFFYINLSDNQFSGPLRASLFESDPIRLVYLSNNEFTGTIPAAFVDAPELRDLYLDRNLLTGTIPNVPAGRLQTLQELLVDENAIVGTMPIGMCSLRGGLLETLWADCAIPPDPPEVTCAQGCCTCCEDCRAVTSTRVNIFDPTQ
eukprot:CAMPEP_0198287064 /NCGR_PEP_ID=MMETSP1449-20131203/5994_1 /TAXON_ID=420275 /ORGANISM="Attheya septentrionalis, Strain CCMP2084" /LENGTH=612 /DNA_ID=CAMNT_0043984959 /DNA_START=184 /DNA_END=2025 /DNA_ORIENTATION=-